MADKEFFEKLDYFAGQALAGELASQSNDVSWTETQSNALASLCWGRALCMMEERALTHRRLKGETT